MKHTRCNTKYYIILQFQYQHRRYCLLGSNWDVYSPFCEYIKLTFLNVICKKKMFTDAKSIKHIDLGKFFLESSNIPLNSEWKCLWCFLIVRNVHFIAVQDPGSKPQWYIQFCQNSLLVLIPTSSPTCSFLHEQIKARVDSRLSMFIIMSSDFYP